MNEEGVSVVIGAVLFLGIAMAAVITFQVDFVPAIQENEEAKRSLEVRDEFARLQSAVTMLMDNATGSQAVSITTYRDSSGGFFRTSVAAGSLTFDDGSVSSTVDSTELVKIVGKGVFLGAVDETWTGITSGAEITDVGELEHLRIRVLDPGNEDDGDSVTMTLTDANGDFAGDVRVYIAEFPSGYAVRMRIRDADLDVLFDDGESRFQQDSPAMVWVNPWQSGELLFPAVFESATKPVTLTFTKSGMNGDYAISYTEFSSGSSSSTTGKSIPNYSEQWTGGRLTFKNLNQHFIQQNLVFEHGAVIIEQPDGSTMLHDPLISVQHSASRTSMNLQLPVLTGASKGFASAGDVIVLLDPTSNTDYQAWAPNYGLNVTTAYPAAWMDYWNRTLEGVGMTSGTHFDLTSGSDWVKVTLNGPISTPPSTKDVFIELRQAKLATTLKG